ncbi:NAD(P)/FAD-dependent oxidoreductase [Saxibacter everestensis]|uniref:NAD(P)/FAD-dependent oxidoreductase n=1 Tax=Saxibacter everestensis TaxID=2909229 RepID=A0ABY8QWP0_9MICO|nr:NAD(P)/FAD-dependent oxidoreductase [Brevibacteriaceae bacterium ZFBP1038]
MMLEEASLTEQAAAGQNDPLRVLIVGAGIAGITIAQLLRRNGLHPTLVERSAQKAGAGYMLALMPMVDPAIADLSLREAYLDRSTPIRRFGFRSHTGAALREDTLEDMVDRYGDYRGISRAELIETLSLGGCPVAFNTTVTSLQEAPGGTRVTLSSAGEQREREFDLVIAADGVNSTTRALILGEQEPIDRVDTQWGGWVAWIRADDESDLGEELWGAGFFVGSYPVAGKLGVFVGGPRKETAVGPADFATKLQANIRTLGGRVEDALNAIVDGEDVFYWPLIDARAPRWSKGRAILLGDAAAGFLPTAGIGAGMAMESAWVLARILRHAGPATIPGLLRGYETAQRPRVEAGQDTSRRLARVMFRRSRLLAGARDVLVKQVSVQAMLKPVQQILDHKPEPDRVAAEWT